MYFFLMQCLRLLKFLHDIGIYDETVGDIKKISGDDYPELVMLGLENVAPIFNMEELGEEHCCGGHIVYHFSDPALLEYYRLCRLYEFKHSITPEENPYVIKADDFFVSCLEYTKSEFGCDYDDIKHPRGIWIETCPERYAYEQELIGLVYDMMEFYQTEVEALRAELLKGPVVYLPALPGHINQANTKKPCEEAGKQLKKAG